MRRFKGWALPGPDILAEGAEPTVDESLDSLSGSYKIFQLKKGHRFSTDDLLVAWYATQNSPTALHALDLGSGIGTVAQIIAFKFQGCHFTTIEAQEVSIELAKKSVALNGLQHRFHLMHGDFRTLFLPEQTFDLITGSPPYFPIGTGALSEHPQKVACRFEVRGSIFDYCKKASAHLSSGGFFTFVFVDEQNDRAIQGIRDAGLALVRTRPVVLKEGEPPLLRLYTCMKKDHVPENWQDRTLQESPLIIRNSNGEVSHEYSLVKLSIGFPAT